MWSEVNFGKWKDKRKTLPQILMSDPDWFFWAIESGVFDKYKKLAAEAELLNRRARSIRVPNKHAPNDTVQYWVTPDGKFAHIALIQSSQPSHQGSSSETRRDYLDLSAPRSIKNYDKLGCKQMLKGFKYYWFDDKAFSKAKVEAFFSDPANFLYP